MIKEKKLTSELQQTVSNEEKQLILHNDETNTFDHIIETLIAVCEHQPEQAEQCALIAHYKGKCGVKNGDIDYLSQLRSEMHQRGLSATVD